MHTPKLRQFTTSSWSCKVAKGAIKSGDNFPWDNYTGDIIIRLVQLNVS